MQKRRGLTTARDIEKALRWDGKSDYSGLRGLSPSQTRAEDNLRTVKLVLAAYASARTGEVMGL